MNKNLTIRMGNRKLLERVRIGTVEPLTDAIEPTGRSTCGPAGDEGEHDRPGLP
jgi:hypothetical protein